MRDALLTDSWTDRTVIGRDSAWARSLVLSSCESVVSRSGVWNRSCTFLEKDPPNTRSSRCDAAFLYFFLSLSFFRFLVQLERRLRITTGSRIFARVGKDRDLDRATGGLHLPNRMIFPSMWRHRETRARNRRMILFSSRTPSATCSSRSPPPPLRRPTTHSASVYNAIADRDRPRRSIFRVSSRAVDRKHDWNLF